MNIQIADTLIAREAVLAPSLIADVYHGLTRQLANRYAGYLNDSLAIANPELKNALYSPDGHLRPHISADRLRALSKYLLRAASRTTPYGMFAAVGVRRWGNDDDDRASDNREIRVCLRPDYEVIAEIIALLDGQFHPEMRCVVNQCRVRRGGRIYIHSTNDTSMRVSEFGTYEHRYSAASIRVTPAIQKLEARTTWPATLGTLLDDIVAPQQTPEAAVQDLLTLVRSRYLIPEYEIAPSATAHAMVRRSLTSDGLIFDDHRLDLSAPNERVTRLYDACTSNFRARTPIAADLIRVDAPSVCPLFKPQVSLLAHAYISCARPTSLDRYRYRFERYVEGTLRAVPILELIDERRGLGTRELTSAEGESSFDRERIKRELMRAIRAQKEELSFTEQDFLEIFKVREHHKVRSFEVAFEICHALGPRPGPLPIVPSAMGGSSGAFRSFGRFSYAFQPQSHVSNISNKRVDDVVYADLYYRPSSARSANVAIGPQTSEYQIAIGCFPNGNQREIDVDDLFVWSDGIRLRWALGDCRRR